jgi:hypothetical protein
MKKRTCAVCEECERIRLLVGRKKPLAQYICEHGVFVLSGPAPKTKTEADRLFLRLKQDWGLTNQPGPKQAEISPGDIWSAYQKMPLDDTKLEHLAMAIGVSESKIQAVLRADNDCMYGKVKRSPVRYGEHLRQVKTEYFCESPQRQLGDA